MIIHRMKQRSADWYEARLGLPTASEISVLLVNGKASHGFGVSALSYMNKLIGERITGESADIPFDTVALKRGRELEAVALDLYRQDTEVVEIGGIENLGAWYSPDGMIGSDGLVEVKSHKPSILIDMLLDPGFPSEHVDQCEFGLLLSGRAWIDLVGYFPGMPLLHRRMFRDEVRLEKLKHRLDKFNAMLDERMAKVLAL